MNLFKRRSHTCGELRASHIGQTVTLNGWVHSRRDLGGVIFIHLRDRYGKTQVVFNPEENKEAHAVAGDLRNEFVISVTGVVRKRPAGSERSELQTGEVDVQGQDVQILSRAETPPFAIEDDTDVGEELRLKYRYLDLRRPSLQKNLLLRHRLYQIVHRYFDQHGFVEVETPMLMKSTPEGARDFLVPSRLHRGRFYALPQSPQTYKQLLMVSGLDRYVQIVKCFRDEDLRADRQPEFTQIDLEMSFIDESDIHRVTEELMKEIFRDIKGVEITTPFPRLTYREAMESYGSDKPDTRFGLKFRQVNHLVADSGFKVFAESVQKGGVVAGFVLPGGAALSRSRIDAFVEKAKELGGKGLAYIRIREDGADSPIAKFLGGTVLEALVKEFRAGTGDLILLVSDSWRTAYTVLGGLRLHIGASENLIDRDSDHLLWVTEFPLFEFSEEENRYVSVHHPFTSPHPDDVQKLKAGEKGEIRARAYDLVLNGSEIAGGSIRIHDQATQAEVFKLLGIGQEEASLKFGFLMNAFRYGAPPHGGIAFGFDRIAMLLAGMPSIRDVIAFPKTASAVSLMDGAPGPVDEGQLRELHIRTTEK